tara:strand:- start:238504 stop:238959 length:456 start_codon:yes stop_codon:yes gene_type:complete
MNEKYGVFKRMLGVSAHDSGQATAIECNGTKLYYRGNAEYDEYVFADIYGEKFDEWGCFVSVAFNNAALDEGGVMSQMLKNEFGFRAEKDIPVALLEASELQGQEEAPAKGIAMNAEDLPLARKYASHIQTANACNEARVVRSVLKKGFTP